MISDAAVALWGASNRTRESSVFHVEPGHAVILTAVGFGEEAEKVAGEATVPQTACVERVLHEFSVEAWHDLSHRCEWVADLNRRLAEEISSEAVAVGECGWSLDFCSNVGVVGLPGTYRLRFNDDSMIGVANVYAQLVGLRDVRPDGLFFG